MIERNRFGYIDYITILVGLMLILYIPFNIMIEWFNLTYGPRLTDFDTYYYSAERFMNGESLYAEAVAPNGSSRQFMYPPISIIIFIPFTYLQFTTAGIIWNILSLVMLSIGVAKLLTELIVEFELGHSNVQLYNFVILSVVGFSPTINWIKSGQASGIIAGGLCLSMAYTLVGKRTSKNMHMLLAGAIIPMVCSIKPYYAPSGAHLVQNIRRFGHSIIGSIIIVASSLILFGSEIHIRYIDQLLQGESSLIFTIPPSDWNAAIYLPLYFFGDSALYIRIILVVVTVASVLVLSWYNYDKLNIALLGLVIIPVATPTRVDGLVALIPVYLVLLIRYWKYKSFRIFTLLSIMLVHIHPYTIELLAKLGPRYSPVFDRLTHVIPVIQPALWGHILLFVLLSYSIKYERLNDQG